MKMNIFENYKILKGTTTIILNGKKREIHYDSRKEFSEVYHITHITASKYLLESKRIIPQLVQDKSKLNTERIKVVWLSPNTWADGSMYGNIRLSFDFNKLIQDKNFYAVEVMDKYNPIACRILITSKNYNTHSLLSPYNPYNEFDGPWHIDSSGKNYYHKNYNIEFMFDDELLLNDASKIDFVKHHPIFCNVKDNGSCKDLDKSLDLSELIFVSHLIANDIKLENLNFYLSKDDDNWTLINITAVLYKIFSKLNKLQDFEGKSSMSAIVKTQLCKSILDLIGKENFDEAVILSQALVSKDDLEETMRNLFGEYFEVESSKLYT
jgi:hypothetical protein